MFSVKDQDIYICAKQISQNVIGTKYLQINPIYQYINHKGEKSEFVYDKNRIVKKPGYEIMITNLSSASFEENNGHIYLNMQRNKRNYKFVITYAQKQSIEDTL